MSVLVSLSVVLRLCSIVLICRLVSCVSVVLMLL